MNEKKLYINRWQLFWSGACRADREKFKKLFGWKAELTAANMRKAIKGGLWVRFFLDCCRVPPKLKSRLRQLYKEYRRKELGEDWW